jgi:hypothetical protein
MSSLQLKRAEKRRRTHNETNTEVRIGICKACGRGPRQVTYGDSVCCDETFNMFGRPLGLKRPLPCVKRQERNALRNQ